MYFPRSKQKDLSQDKLEKVQISYSKAEVVAGVNITFITDNVSVSIN